MVYDTIVIGAGAAGAVLAARLSEDPAHRVLLLEAGRDYRAGEAPPEMRSINPFNLILPKHFQAIYMWPGLSATRTARQKPRIYWRGRGVGGSTSINGIIAIRGVLDAFDAWAEAGCAGWSGAEVLPFFNRLEDDLDYGDRPYHGRAGPIPIHRAPPDRWGPVDRGLRDAALDLGYPWTDDLNAPDAEGVTTYAINCRNGVRVSTNDAYLEPVRDRPNLVIRGETPVERIVTDGARAVGVVARTLEGAARFDAREIVLCAGAIHSPAILMRSGIGPAGHLRSLGIDIVRDLPVGDNLFDHPFVRIELELQPELRPVEADARHTNCCVKYSSGLPGGSFCDMIMFAMNHGGVGVEIDPDMFGQAGIHVALFEAFSRGTVRLASADPDADPIVDLDMLSDARDLARMRDGARRLLRIGTHGAISAIAERVLAGNTGHLAAEMLRMPDAALDDWLLTDCSDAQHGAGSCRMGDPRADPSAVVDPAGRVVGIDGLRVADASIMPLDCKANTALTTIMIGEHIAERMRSARAS